ncbi:MAG: inositol monophosphatase [Pseudomonadota bacterium]
MSLDDAALNHLIAAVRRAGQTEILPRFRNLADDEMHTKSGPDDLVTIADTRAEAMIAAAARDALPDALIVGEEAVAEDPILLEQLKTADCAVIIDPVDGTSNFAHGLSVFGTILSVVLNGQTEFGLLYDPLCDDWVMARRGQGAAFVTESGQRTQLSARNPVQAVDADGYVCLQLFPKDQQAELAAAYPSFNSVSNLRCSCHEYRMIAFGHADFILAAHAKPWDHAAGALILREIGGGVFFNHWAPYAPTSYSGPLIALANAGPTTREMIETQFSGLVQAG